MCAINIEYDTHCKIENLYVPNKLFTILSQLYIKADNMTYVVCTGIPGLEENPHSRLRGQW